MKGELLHDYFTNREGGGKLILTLGKNWNWNVTGGFVSEEFISKIDLPNVQLKSLGVIPTFLPIQSIKLARHWYKYHSHYSRIIYSGTYSPMSAVNQTDADNIFYCHTPPRFIYDQRSYYLSRLPGWQRPAFLALIAYLKRRYEKAVSNMDRIVANSENVQRRIKRFLGRDSTVVYPPCDVEQYQWLDAEGYYLSTARLDPLKRVDLVVEAFRKMPDRSLIVVSDGAERQRLIKLAADADNIKFLGAVSDTRLRNLIAHCIATVYIPREEDFGMSPVESMAAGKPVIGVAEGGLLETIIHDQTGYLLPGNPKPEHLIDAVLQLNSNRARAMREACEQRADLFRTNVFLKKMQEVVYGTAD